MNPLKVKFVSIKPAMIRLRNPAAPTLTHQRGAALVISLLVLVVLTIIGVTSTQTTTLEEKMSGNYRDSNLAFQSAESALQEAERWLRVRVNPTDPNDVWSRQSEPPKPDHPDYDTLKNLRKVLEPRNPSSADPELQNSPVWDREVLRTTCGATDTDPWWKRPNCGANLAWWLGSSSFSVEAAGTIASYADADTTHAQVVRRPRYIIEYIGLGEGSSRDESKDTPREHLYRITARGEGGSSQGTGPDEVSSAVVVVQAVLAIRLKDM